jgi:hypothetical protein
MCHPSKIVTKDCLMCFVNEKEGLL